MIKLKYIDTNLNVKFSNVKDVINYVNKDSSGPIAKSITDIKDLGYYIVCKLKERRKYFQSLLNQKVSCVCSGLIVKGIVKEFKEDKHCFSLIIEHEPVRWGNDLFTKSFAFENKHDLSGSMMYVKLLD